MNQLALHIYLN